jgi:hypothetical protein
MFSGCASITGTEMQNLSLLASDKEGGSVAGADCKLSNDKGNWTAKPPAIAMVQRSAEDLIVHCDARDQPPGIARAISRANSAMFGNILFGGGIGAMIDHSKGTAYDYPSQIRVVFGATIVVDKKFESANPPVAAVVPAPAAKAQGNASERGSAAGPNTPAAPALPASGASYRYLWAERQYGRQPQEFQVRVTGVEGWRVLESFTVDGRTTAAEIQAREQSFTGRPLGEGQSLLEFAPYLEAQNLAALQGAGDATAYPGNGQNPWTISVQAQGWEQVTVPAGTYRAMRVEVRGSRSVDARGAGVGVTRRFEFTVWYAPELKRYAKLRHRAWNALSPVGDENVELVEYRAN